MQTRRIQTLLLSLTFAVLTAAESPGQTVPSLINYQGKLTDAAGSPLPNGTYGVGFRIWNKKSASEAGNTLIWGQEYSVAVQSGVFNVILGAPGGAPVTNAPTNSIEFAFSEAERYIALTVTRGTNGLAVANATEIVPRQQVLSSPYALVAANALNASHAAVAETVVNGVPAGSIIPYGASSAPPGWMFCDGSAISRTSYSNLFSAFGTSYGVGDGSTTFNIPDLRGRVVVAQDPAQTEFDSLGRTGGKKTHTLTVAEMPAHNHTGTFNTSQPHHVGSNGNGWRGPTDMTGGDQPHNNLQPYIVLKYIVKL